MVYYIQTFTPTITTDNRTAIELFGFKGKWASPEGLRDEDPKKRAFAHHPLAVVGGMRSGCDATSRPPDNPERNIPPRKGGVVHEKKPVRAGATGTCGRATARGGGKGAFSNVPTPTHQRIGKGNCVLSSRHNQSNAGTVGQAGIP